MQRLDHSLEMFREAHRMSIAMATKFAEVIDDPSDLGVLYRINVYMIDGTDMYSSSCRISTTSITGGLT